MKDIFNTLADITRPERTMIQANELRIGNWVMGNAPYQVGLNQISLHASYLQQGKQGYFEPIPLTEDILLKCGLNFKKLGFSEISISYGTKSKEIHFVIGSYYFRIYYLHKLQNMYFEITGKELEIEL